MGDARPARPLYFGSVEIEQPFNLSPLERPAPAGTVPIFSSGGGHSPLTDADWSWYRIFMQVSAIAFVVVDARDRSCKADALREAGVTNLGAYLRTHPEDFAIIKSATIIDLNDTAIRMFGGTDRTDFVGQQTTRFFDPLCPVLKNISDAYFHGRSEYQEQARSLRLDGTRFDTIFAAVMRAPGVTHGIWLAAFIDITDELKRRIAFDGLRDELAHVSRISMLGELSASIAHELGQPLSTIEISAAAATRMLDRPEPDIAHALEIIARISAQARRSHKIIERVRSMAARRSPNAARVAIGDLVREAYHFVRHEIERNQVAISFEIPDSGQPLLVDQIQFQQVIVNLLMNAVQIMRDHQVAQPRIVVRGEAESDRYVLEVEDCGPGILESDIAQVFDSFYTSRVDGLGLGLSICRTIVEAHGGAISVANRGGGTGATFTVELPLPAAV